MYFGLKIWLKIQNLSVDKYKLPVEIGWISLFLVWLIKKEKNIKTWQITLTIFKISRGDSNHQDMDRSRFVTCFFIIAVKTYHFKIGVFHLRKIKTRKFSWKLQRFDKSYQPWQCESMKKRGFSSFFVLFLLAQHTKKARILELDSFLQTTFSNLELFDYNKQGSLREQIKFWLNFSKYGWKIKVIKRCQQ